MGIQTLNARAWLRGDYLSLVIRPYLGNATYFVYLRATKPGAVHDKICYYCLVSFAKLIRFWATTLRYIDENHFYSHPFLAACQRSRCFKFSRACSILDVMSHVASLLTSFVCIDEDRLHLIPFTAFTISTSCFSLHSNGSIHRFHAA